MAARVAYVAALLFAAVMLWELQYWSAHDYNTVAGLLAVVGAAGVLLALVVAYALSQVRHAVFWADTAMWNIRQRSDQG